MDDLMRTKDGNKLLITSAGALRIGTSCCGKLAILIYNSNSAVDDDFDVRLNGTSIGTINNNANSCTGRIFAEDTAITTATYATGITCITPTFESTLALNMALLVASNTLRIESIADHDNGNAGTVRVVCVNWNGTTYTTGKIFLSSSYGFADGVGNGQNYTFAYP